MRATLGCKTVVLYVWAIVDFLGQSRNTAAVVLEHKMLGGFKVLYYLDCLSETIKTKEYMAFKLIV